MRRRAEIHETGNLPEDILGLCSICQEDLRAAAHGEILGDLEHPDVARSTREGDIRRD